MDVNKQYQVEQLLQMVLVLQLEQLDVEQVKEKIQVQRQDVQIVQEVIIAQQMMTHVMRVQADIQVQQEVHIKQIVIKQYLQDKVQHGQETDIQLLPVLKDSIL